MRQQHGSIEIDQRLRHLRLVREHVEPRPEDRPRLKRGDQRRLVDDAAAGDVDHDAVSPERRQHPGIDDPVRARPAGCGHDQRIDRLRQPEQAVVVGVGNVGLRRAPVIGDPHAEPFEPLGDRPSDPAEPEDADPALPQARGEREAALPPAPGAQVAVGLRDLAEGGEQEAQREVGHLVGEHVRRVGDDDAAAMRLARIDRVVADAEARHDLELRQPVEQPRIDRAHRADREPADARSHRVEERLAVGRLLQAVQAEALGEPPGHVGAGLPDQEDVGRLGWWHRLTASQRSARKRSTKDRPGVSLRRAPVQPVRRAGCKSVMRAACARPPFRNRPRSITQEVFRILPTIRPHGFPRPGRGVFRDGAFNPSE